MCVYVHFFIFIFLILATSDKWAIGFGILQLQHLYNRHDIKYNFTLYLSSDSHSPIRLCDSHSFKIISGYSLPAEKKKLNKPNKNHSYIYVINFWRSKYTHSQIDRSYYQWANWFAWFIACIAIFKLDARIFVSHVYLENFVFFFVFRLTSFTPVFSILLSTWFFPFKIPFPLFCLCSFFAIFFSIFNLSRIRFFLSSLSTVFAHFLVDAVEKKCLSLSWFACGNPRMPATINSIACFFLFIRYKWQDKLELCCFGHWINL